MVLDPLAEHLRERARAPEPGSVIAAVGSRVTGMQAGSILAYLAGRVLGQYELFLPPDAAAPLARRRRPARPWWRPTSSWWSASSGSTRTDFRRWVCLHEETHRTQFTAVPWLRGYVQQQMTEFLLASDLDPAAILERVRARRRCRGRGGAGRRRQR